MEDFSMQSMSYPGNLERVFQNKRARTLITCYTVRHQFPRSTQSRSKGALKSRIMKMAVY